MVKLLPRNFFKCHFKINPPHGCSICNRIPMKLNSNALIASMKVVQISTTVSGGAGIAALRLNETLNEFGVDSTLFFSDRHVKTDFARSTNWKKSPLKQVMSSLNTILQRWLQSDSYSPLSVYSVSMSRKQRKELREFDLIHIHNFFNILSNRDINFLAGLGKPIFLTLHDERHYTGACHLTLGCDHYLSNCLDCPQIKRPFEFLVTSSGKRRRKALQNIPNLNVIAPSVWIGKRSGISSTLGMRETRVIPNPIPSVFFDEINLKKSQDNFVSREREWFTTLGFIAADISNPLKNIGLLFSALDSLKNSKDPKKYKLIIVGRNKLNLPLPEDVEIIETQNPEETIEVLKKIDVLIVTSLAENLPNVISEALALGLQVIGSNVGGIPEMITARNGIVFDQNSDNALAEAIQEIPSRANSKIISREASEIYGQRVVAEKMLTFYRSSLSQDFGSNT